MPCPSTCKQSPFSYLPNPTLLRSKTDAEVRMASRLFLSHINMTLVGAQLMGNIAELILRTHPEQPVPTEILQQAESWVKKGLEVSKAARNEARNSSGPETTCEAAYSVLLFNLAVIREVS